MVLKSLNPFDIQWNIIKPSNAYLQHSQIALNIENAGQRDVKQALAALDSPFQVQLKIKNLSPDRSLFLTQAQLNLDFSTLDRESLNKFSKINFPLLKACKEFLMEPNEVVTLLSDKLQISHREIEEAFNDQDQSMFNKHKVVENILGSEGTLIEKKQNEHTLIYQLLKPLALNFSWKENRTSDPY